MLTDFSNFSVGSKNIFDSWDAQGAGKSIARG